MNYRLEHFLLFSHEVYNRLLNTLSEEFLGFSIVVNLGLVVLMGYWRRQGMVALMFVMLTLCWAWVGWRFYIIDYASINRFSVYLGIMCLIQLPCFIAVAKYIANRPCQTEHTLLYICICYLVFFRPLFMYMLGAPLSLSALGVLPVPTLLLSVGLLLSVKVPFRGTMLIVPIALLAVETLTLYALEDIRWQEGPVIAVLLAMVSVSGKYRLLPST